MRFIQNGPAIPDDLLTARDAGQVLFFCGAGVSQAEAGLPNFPALAERVLASLGSAQDSPARRLFDAARRFEKASGQTGMVATDRIFGLLEREFEAVEVREAVAMALKPEPGYGLDAHRTLLDLSRTRSGMPRLVTTNFDLLFEDCEPGIRSSNPPRLPDPRRDGDFRGIIHLHGRVDAQYCRAEDDEFVLSSADFGHAYLSDGWATHYIQSLMHRFRIVFVGYSADDPPVQYLLEALNRFAKPAHGLFAFQAGDSGQAAAQWMHKGVEPICYDSTNGHAALWQTLSAWAERARNVDGWHDKLLVKATHGPAAMAPYERGMIAHLVSTFSGSSLLARSGTTLPADWLFVIDRSSRYGQAGKASFIDEMSPHFDPFDEFCLDSDTLPVPTSPEDRLAKREVPQDAWDGFVSTPADRKNLPAEATARLIGRADSAATLPPRLLNLGLWIAKIAHQPATLWWASKQAPLHPDIQALIERSLRYESARYLKAVRDGWRMLFAYWKQSSVDPSLTRYTIEEQAKQEGWSPSLVREGVALYRPMLTVRPAREAKAPESHPELALSDIVLIGVEYPQLHDQLNIPPEMLTYAVTLFRQQLEYAVALEHEVSGHDGIYLDTITPDDGETLDEDSYGLTGRLVIFTNMVMKLCKVDASAARSEVIHWSGMSDKVFTRLRIWAGGQVNLTTPEEAGRFFLNLDDVAFWISHKRDLLFALRDRWSDIPASMTAALETRLSTGHFPLDVQREDSDELVANYRLNWLHWLSTQGVKFSFDLDTEFARLRAIAPNWTEDSIKHTAQPNVSKVFRIETDTSAAPLERLPIGEVLEKAEALGQDKFDARVNRQPFRGLAQDRPARALRILTDAARRDKFVPWAWRALLSPDGDTALPPRMLSAIGHRLARLSPDHLAEIVHPASAWLLNRGDQLFSERPQAFDLLWNAVIRALMTAPEAKRFRRPDRRWVEEGLNMPAGRLASALFKDPARKTFKAGQGLPDVWTSRIDQLLGLPGDHRQHAIVIITSRLDWLFQIVPDWIADRLLPLSKSSGDDGKAFWAGYFWAAQVPKHQLYLLLKPRFIQLAGQPGLRREHADGLAGMLLAGWGNDEDDAESRPSISDIELREVLIHADEEMRIKTLMYLKRWALEPGGQWRDCLLPFLLRVWPRQRAVRTARVSDRLVALAFAIPDRFAEIVGAILPRLTVIQSASLMMHSLTKDNEKLIESHPKTLLDLLWAILSEAPAEWPYGTSDVIAKLAKNTETQFDPRLTELVRREQQRF